MVPRASTNTILQKTVLKNQQKLKWHTKGSKRGTEKQKDTDIWKTNSKMLAITLSIPIISLNVIGLNTQKVEIVRMD